MTGTSALFVGKEKSAIMEKNEGARIPSSARGKFGQGEAPESKDLSARD